MKITNLLIAILCVGITACSSAPRKPVDPSVPTGRIYGTIVKMQKTPERCEKPSSTGAMLVGAVIGGVIGNQFGGGNGKIATTVLGAGAGGKIGSNTNKNKALVCKKRGYLYTLAYLDNNHKQKYTTKRFERSKPVGETIEFKLKY
jgi:uncharacterized protein YcfJ